MIHFFAGKCFFFVFKRILDCISSKKFLISINKSLISFIFSLCFESDKRLHSSNFNTGSFHVKWTKISKVGTWPISDSDETFPAERYVLDKVILKILVQPDNSFKSYDTSKLSQYVNWQKLRGSGSLVEDEISTACKRKI